MNRTRIAIILLACWAFFGVIVMVVKLLELIRSA